MSSGRYMSKYESAHRGGSTTHMGQHDRPVAVDPGTTEATQHHCLRGSMRERENLWLRSILIGVAQELERMAARGQGDTRVLLGRARRVRQRLHPSTLVSE